MRVFDNPNHPQYGPVRRLWIMLVQLNLAIEIERHRYPMESLWDVKLAETIEIGVKEHIAQRAILTELFERMNRR